MEITKSTIVDIDQVLWLMERVLSGPPVPTTDLWFVLGQRFPLSDRLKLDEYLGCGIARNHPYHPYLSAGLYREMLYVDICDRSYYPDFIPGNVMLPDLNSPIYTTCPDDTYEDVVHEMFPHLPTTVVGMLVDLYKDSRSKVLDHTNDHGLIYSIDINTNHFIIHQHIDIRAFRFQEMIDHMALSDD